MRIALDAMGGDHAPGPIVMGAVQAVQKDADMHVVLVGDQAQIEPLLSAAGSVRDRLESRGERACQPLVETERGNPGCRRRRGVARGKLLE